MTCNSRFARLLARCIDPFASILGVRVGSAPFGQDPSFNPSSVLFDASAADNPGLYYNTSQGSQEISALGNPYGFFPSDDHTMATPFSLVLPVRHGRSCLHNRAISCVCAGVAAELTCSERLPRSTCLHLGM